MILIMFLEIPYHINAVEEYKVLDPKYNISPDHEFTIKLSQELNEDSLKDGTVKVIDRTTLQTVEIEVRRDTYDAKAIKVKAKNNFEVGKTYTIEVKNLKSKKDKYLNQSIKMDFVVKNAYSGLPAENGLIIVDDKAYAIDYLIKNITMVNEIVTKSYDVYYTYDVNYEKIYSLFKTGPVYGGTSGTKYTTMTYIDPDGKSHLYLWNDDKQEYELEEPKANVEVIVRSDAKAVKFNVLNVIAVPDAKYYKIKNSNLIKSFGDPILYVAAGDTEELSILSEDKSVLAKGTVNIFKNNSEGVKLRLSDNLKLGNTAANINNNGIAAEDDEGYIYYVNSGDKDKLYKKSSGGVFNRTILEDKAQYINQSGDWIYYSNYSDGGLLYKIKKDGTERQKLLDDKAAYITVSGEYVYYSNHSDGGKLYKIKKDASDAEIWSDKSKHGNPIVVDYGNYNKTTDEVAYINIVGDWIYYSNYSDGHKPYVINKDGTYRGKLSDNYADCIQVEGDWIYFTSGSGVISKINKNNKGNIIPIKGTTNEFNKGYHINVYGDWIYYSNSEDGGKLYKISTDGSGKKIKLSDETVGYINIVGDWIYFTTTKNKLYRLPISTNGEIKPEEVGAVKDANKISQVEDIYITVDFADVNQTTEWLEKNYLPNKVAALMGDDTMQQLVVAWDTSKVTFKNGVRTYKGTLVGYNKTINLYMTIPSEMLNDTNKITVYKNGNKNDIVIVEGDLEPTTDTTKTRIRIGEGDILKVYADYNKTKLLGTATAGKDKKAVLSKLDLDGYGESFYITVTRVNKAESNPTAINQYAAPIILYGSEGVLDKDTKWIGVDTRDITITGWTPAKPNSYYSSEMINYGFQLKEQEIYVLPSKMALDMTKHSPVIDGLNTSITSWDGSNLSQDDPYAKNKDSQGVVFKSGSYDVFVSAYYTGYGHPDIENRKPQIEGWIANAQTATVSMQAEGIPAKPNLAAQRVQGSEGGDGTASTKTNAIVNIPKALSEGEVAWLVPVDLVDVVKGWTAEQGASPFEELYKSDANDLVKFQGAGTVMSSPKGNTVAPYYDKDYKLFIVNNVGASAPSDNVITVDNRKPAINLSSTSTYDVGAPINVSTDEKGKIYIVQDDVNLSTLTPKILDQAVAGKNALVISHSGNNLFAQITKTETLLDFSIGGITLDPDYYVLSVDEAGNISDPKSIKIIRNVDDLRDTINAAQIYLNDHPDATASLVNEIVNLINKANTIYSKPTATQAEINLIKEQLNAKIRPTNFVLTVSTNDNKNVAVTNTNITVNQMTAGKLLAKLVVSTGVRINVYDKDSGSAINPTDILLSNKMVVRAEYDKPDGTTVTAEYPIVVNRAHDITDISELKFAIYENELDDITLAVSKITIDEPLTIERTTTILGNSGNLSGAANSDLVIGPNGKIINSSNLTLKKINFIGDASGRDTDVIDNVKNGTLTIEKSNFTGFKFINNDGISLIKSEIGSTIKLNTCSFSAGAASGLTFYHLNVSNSVLPGTTITNCTFSGTDGKNVKGIYINGTNETYNDIVISKNTFKSFSSSEPKDMAIPIYIEGGKVSLTSNVISAADIGVFIDITKKPEINGNRIYEGVDLDQINSAGKNVAKYNTSITKNFFGDIVIGKNVANNVPIFYYNSTSTPTIGNISAVTKSDGNTYLVIGDELGADTDKLVFKRVENKSTYVPAKGYTVPVKDLATYIDITKDINDTDAGSGNYAIVVELDKSNKVVKYRTVIIP